MNQRHLFTLCVLLVIFNGAAACAADELLYIGSHSPGPGKGFSVAHFDSETGKLSVPEFTAEAESPSYFVIAPDGKHLYAANEVGQFHGEQGGGVTAYAIDPAGKLTIMNSQPTGGADTCFISLDKTGKFLLTASYSGGNVAVFEVKPDGSVGKRTAFDQHTGSSVHPQRQTKAYAHSMRVDPTNKYALVADLGVDKVYVYKFNEADGTLTPNEPAFATVKPGSGPRHFFFHPNGKWMYLLNEMANTVVAYEWDSAKGTLSEVQTIGTLPDGFQGNSTSAEIEIHPNGKFLYSSNRGSDTIAMFTIDQSTGKLTKTGDVPTKGRTPRNFKIDPSGNWIVACNQQGNNIVVYKIDPESGKLTQTGDPVPLTGPFCDRFLILAK